MPAAKSVTVIPATIQQMTKLPVGKTARRRVAGYARVSTDSDEQFTSYEAQVDYYTKYIQSRPDWVFVEVYKRRCAQPHRPYHCFDRACKKTGTYKDIHSLLP